MTEQDVNMMIEKFYKFFFEIEKITLDQGLKSLTLNEVHTIDAIGMDNLAMTELAFKLGVSPGTCTISVNKLNRKGYIKRMRSLEDRRKVIICLSKEGKKVLNFHQTFHKNTIYRITKGINGDDLEKFFLVLKALIENLNDYQNSVRLKTDSELL